MRYKNPVVKGFYPDPSVCFANNKFYMVCSSFQYFPGVPLFESDNLVNWTQIGHVLTRKSQVMLDEVSSSGGVFAPTIRYNDGRFYMVTNNNTTQRNFYVYTDDIYGEWSDPIEVDQGGIDPSLYFEKGHCYFISNGQDDNGVAGIVQCEIEITTGKKLTASRTIWTGSGGRYLESPHMYKIDGVYYLIAAEGGTEYGHMVTCARGKSVWGTFENHPKNPILTNRNKAPYMIQGIGHGDLVQDMSGNWYLVSLGFRQIHMWMPYHHLGREVFLTPVQLRADGWFYCGIDGTTDEYYGIPGEFVQEEKKEDTFDNTKWELDWCYLRHPKMEHYEFYPDKLVLHGSDVTLDETLSPTFIGIRQRDFNFELSVEIKSTAAEAGVTLYMSETEHYDLAMKHTSEGCSVILKLNIGRIHHIQKELSISENCVKLVVKAEAQKYYFYVDNGTEEIFLDEADTKYLSSEVAGGFTGVVMGLYAIKGNCQFQGFRCHYL